MGVDIRVVCTITKTTSLIAFTFYYGQVWMNIVIFAIIHKVKLPTTATTFLIQARSPPPVNKKIDNLSAWNTMRSENISGWTLRLPLHDTSSPTWQNLTNERKTPIMLLYLEINSKSVIIKCEVSRIVDVSILWFVIHTGKPALCLS